MYNHLAAMSRRGRHKVLTMIHFIRRSLLTQLIGVYLVFVLIVIGSGMEIDAVGQHQIRDQIQTTDFALAQEIAFETFTTISDTETSLVKIEWAVAGSVNDPSAMESMFTAFMASRQDIDRMYWLDASGIQQVSVPPNPPPNPLPLATDYSSMPLFQRVQSSDAPLVEGGSVDPTNSHDVVTVAEAVHGNHGQFLGMVAATLLLDSLSQQLGIVTNSQTLQGQHVIISLLDDRGLLIGASDPAHAHLLQPEATQLPGAVEALAGGTAASEVNGPNGDGKWLYSAVSVPDIGWAVVVQQPETDITAATSNFGLWLWLATILFAAGGLLFWLVLLRRVIRPLHALAAQHGSLPELDTERTSIPSLTQRSDEIGKLAYSLQGLEREVVVRLTELHTLLETSNAVVNSLDPRAVGATIIREVRRLVDVQAASVLVPDEQGVLRPLASEGRAENYESEVQVPSDELRRPAARALHDGQPVQMIDDGSVDFPEFSAAEGFRSVLAIPIISQRVGGVVLAVHRREPIPFTRNELDLLLTFANYAALAWEHAVLYERSDDRLREVARENERLYHEAMSEKRTLSAIVDSINDGLLLTSPDGTVLYANPGACALLGLSDRALGDLHISDVHQRLAAMSEHPGDYQRSLTRAEAGEIGEWLLEARQDYSARALLLRLFDVRGDGNEAIGRGLLIRDVTHEREVDQFKTTLLAAVGHELRTPLAAIKGHASTLLQDDVTWSQDDQRHSLSTISAEADHLAQLVNNLLDMSRLEAGLLLLHRAPRRFDELAAAVVHRQTVAPERIALELPDDLPPVWVDAPRIEVVMQNLLANALAYSDGPVRVGASQQDDMVRVVVSDDGPGIGDEDLPHIFERFYRARHSHRQTGGTGLGLAICKAFVQAHGGQIWAESGPRGTAIYFTLPAVARSTDDAVASPAENIESRQEEKRALPAVATPSRDLSAERSGS